MSCLLTLGRAKGCKDGVSGVLRVYFVNDLPEADVTKDVNGIITSVANTPSAFKYELRADAEFTQTITTSKENGTTYFEQKLSIVLHHLDATTSKEIKLMAYGSPRIIVETNDQKYFLMGELRGCDMTAGTISSGKAMGDLNGYSLEFTAMEIDYAAFMTSDPATVGFTVVA